MPRRSGAMAEFTGSACAGNGAAVERGTAVGVLPGSRPRGTKPEDAIDLGLVAVARRHGDTVPSLGTTAREHSRTRLGLHTGTEAVRLRAVTAVGLEGTLGHRTVLIRESLPCGQVLSIADSVQIRQSAQFVIDDSAAVSLRRSFALHAPGSSASTPSEPSPSRIFIFACASSSRASHFIRQLSAGLEHLSRPLARLHKQWCKIIFC
jgi:hypothetical protein